MIVVDSSVMALALGHDQLGHQARLRLLEQDIAAPHLIDIEVASVLRKWYRAGILDQHRVHEALANLIDFPLVRFSHCDLLTRIWELHHTITPYDASYVALAESLDVSLLTADARLARATGPRCPIEVF